MSETTQETPQAPTAPTEPAPMTPEWFAAVIAANEASLTDARANVARIEGGLQVLRAMQAMAQTPAP